MVSKVLRFLGAIIAAILFDYLVYTFHFSFFAETAHFFANLSWSNWLSFDIFRGFLLPVEWTILGLIGVSLMWLVRGSKIIAALPTVIFIFNIIGNFYLLFLEPSELIVNDIGQGFWYYFGAILAFIAMSGCYIGCTVSMYIDPDLM